MFQCTVQCYLDGKQVRSLPKVHHTLQMRHHG